MPSTFPMEVIFRVINAIDDRQTLCNCALTCRQWLPTSRYNLFYRLSISHRLDFDALVRACAAPHIVCAFRNVHSLRLWEDANRPFLYLFPEAFPSQFARTEFLEIGGFVGDPFPIRDSSYATGAHFRSVTILKLVDGKFLNFSDFQRLVNGFKQLVRLVVEDVEWRTPPMRSLCAFTSDSPRLESFWFKSPCEGVVPALVEWILHTPSMEVLNDLQLWDHETEDLVHIQRLTQRLGPYLEQFQLSLKNSTRDISLDLSSNSNLRSLHVRDIDAASCVHLPSLLEHISPAHLDDLMLYLSIPTLDDLDLLRQLWIDVSDILESGAFLSLKTLTVFLLKRPPADALDTAALVRELHDWMPLLDSRALLRVFPCLGLDA